MATSTVGQHLTSGPPRSSWAPRSSGPPRSSWAPRSSWQRRDVLPPFCHGAGQPGATWGDAGQPIPLVTPRDPLRSAVREGLTRGNGGRVCVRGGPARQRAWTPGRGRPGGTPRARPASRDGRWPARRPGLAVDELHRQPHAPRAGNSGPAAAAPGVAASPSAATMVAAVLALDPSLTDKPPPDPGRAPDLSWSDAWSRSPSCTARAASLNASQRRPTAVPVTADAEVLAFIQNSSRAFVILERQRERRYWRSHHAYC